MGCQSRSTSTACPAAEEEHSDPEERQGHPCRGTQDKLRIRTMLVRQGAAGEQPVAKEQQRRRQQQLQVHHNHRESHSHSRRHRHHHGPVQPMEAHCRGRGSRSRHGGRGLVAAREPRHWAEVRAAMASRRGHHNLDRGQPRSDEGHGRLRRARHQTILA